MRQRFPALMPAGIALAGAALVLSACHRGLTTGDAPDAQEQQAFEPADGPAVVAALRKDGARAWVDNCMRCHNLRQPHERSDREWETIVHHMRVRANLTAEEHGLILDFLKAAN